MFISVEHGDNMGQALIYYLVLNNILYFLDLLMGFETSYIHIALAPLACNYIAVVE